MTKKEIVVLDGSYANPGDMSWDFLEAYGKVTIYQDTPHDQVQVIKDQVGEASVVITNKVPLGEEVLRACPELKYIIVSATGYNNVDLPVAKNLGILVSNIPAYSSASVAQHCLALLLYLTNQVNHYSQAVGQGRWQEEGWTFYDQDYPIQELDGKCLGVVGFGSIGQAFARICRALGMNVLAYNRSQSPIGQELACYVSLEDLLAKSDVISLHLPLTAQTRHIIDERALSQMKDGVILLNTARGPLLDPQALADALKDGRVKAAGIDVLDQEPMPRDHPLEGLANCILTPHIAWASQESRQRLLEKIDHNLAAYQAGQPINLV